MGNLSVSQVDTSGLARVGAAVEQSAAGFSAACTSRAGALTITGTSAGWGVEGALDGAARAWGEFLAQLSEQVGTVGADLSRSAGEFRAADAAAGNRVAVAGHSPVRLS
jgi:hypothetical protein